jgi:hypothetical protein
MNMFCPILFHQTIPHLSQLSFCYCIIIDENIVIIVKILITHTSPPTPSINTISVNS